MHATEQSDVLVIGGGALGTFHAYHALQRGLSVTLLERDTAPRGATVRNFGQVVPSGLDQTWQEFGRESLSIYKSIQSQFDISVRQNGSIYIASNDEELALIEELRKINAGNDYPSELWTASDCCRRYPQLRADYCRGGLFFPQEVSVNPRQMIHRMHEFLRAQPGFTGHFRTSVNHLENESGGVTATTSDGRSFSATNAILCCGSELETLFPEIFRDSDLELVKLQMLRLSPMPSVSMRGNILTGQSIRRYESFSECPSWTEIKSREPGDSFFKRWGVHILLKQEADGGIIVGDSHEYAPVAQETSQGFEIRTDVTEFFVAEGKRIFDLPQWDIEATWYGTYCQTRSPTGIFQTKLGDSIHIVTGIGGKGMTSSAGFAKRNLEAILND